MYILDEQLNIFLKICYRHETIPNLIGNKLLHEDIYNPGRWYINCSLKKDRMSLSLISLGVGSSDYSHALTKLTSPSSISSPISLSSVVYSTSQKLELGSEFEPISEKEVDSVLQVNETTSFIHSVIFLQYAFPDSFPDYAQKKKEDSYSTTDVSPPTNSLSITKAHFLGQINISFEVCSS